MRRVLTDDHPDLLDYRFNLAHLTEIAGHRDESAALFEALLPDCERVLGTRHSRTREVRERLGR
ncbi:hypothetical protein EV193_102372 [Herbihabitans rhizosphaerae]|uniref:Tetratricopeptide repeat protein n=1 Tax=Herbihabitans rhizosphaerae TaxID=1872711 RepID=A0A4V2EU55_9PSEU|nr:tetratricopeptide repeat-containing protein [Herbihabitans rhizosphaerae]RZS43393.1 hypothetical protein EV193_102372 [Herbihabitans rhizosphaerae]